MTARWIVGIDGSDASVDALRWAVGHAGERDVDVTAIGAFHVPAIMAVFTAKRGFGVDELGLAATAGHDVDVAIETVGDSGVQSVVLEGQAQHVLVDASVDADLVVLGRTGSGELRHHLLGSVSRYCVTHSTRRSWSCRRGRDARRHRSWWVTTAVSTPTKRSGGHWTSPATRPQSGWWQRSRWRRGSTWTATTSVTPSNSRSSASPTLDAVDPERRAERSIVMQGPREALADAQTSADLVVVGTRGRGLVAAELLGSVSTWLIQDATLPVVVVPSR